jgi:hypothetical protein
VNSTLMVNLDSLQVNLGEEVGLANMWVVDPCVNDHMLEGNSSENMFPTFTPPPLLS